MKYNEKYKRFLDDDYVIYRMDKEGKLVQVKPSFNNLGYAQFCYGFKKTVYVHRFIWETLKGSIPIGYEIDHINTIKTDNRIDNLRCVTRSQNMLNPITNKNTIDSFFGKKYFEHYGYSASKNKKQYRKEYVWFKRHGKCRWE